MTAQFFARGPSCCVFRPDHSRLWYTNVSDGLETQVSPRRGWRESSRTNPRTPNWRPRPPPRRRRVHPPRVSRPAIGWGRRAIGSDSSKSRGRSLPRQRSRRLFNRYPPVCRCQRSSTSPFSRCLCRSPRLSTYRCLRSCSNSPPGRHPPPKAPPPCLRSPRLRRQPRPLRRRGTPLHVPHAGPARRGHRRPARVDGQDRNGEGGGGRCQGATPGRGGTGPQATGAYWRRSRHQGVAGDQALGSQGRPRRARARRDRADRDLPQFIKAYKELRTPSPRGCARTRHRPKNESITRTVPSVRLRMWMPPLSSPPTGLRISALRFRVGDRQPVQTRERHGRIDPVLGERD